MKKRKQTPILILHGWKVAGERYGEIKKIFEEKGYAVYIPIMPGFGGEKLLKDVMCLDDYVVFIHRYLAKNKLEKVIIIGHSFGGRVAAKFSYQYPKQVEKLILTGAPLIKRPLSLKKQIISSVAKIGKKSLEILPSQYSEALRKLLYRGIGEWDYYKSGNLRETFKAIISEDLSTLLPKISVPVLVLWGEQDTFVPLKDGKDIANKILDAKLIVLPDGGHKIPYDHATIFANYVLDFIK